MTRFRNAETNRLLDSNTGGKVYAHTANDGAYQLWHIINILMMIIVSI